MFKFAIPFLCLYLKLASSVVDPLKPLEQKITSGKIVGGIDSKIEKVPYQCALIEDGKFICGCSILEELWILTASHCIYGKQAGNYKIRAGSNYHESGGQLIGVKRIITHPKYNNKTTDYDFALLKLNDKLDMESTDKIKTISLPPQGQPTAVGTNCVVSGWGAKISGGEASEKLQRVNVTITNPERCNLVYSVTDIKKTVGSLLKNLEPPDMITDRMLCAGTAGKDSCQGK